MLLHVEHCTCPPAPKYTLSQVTRIACNTLMPVTFNSVRTINNRKVLQAICVTWYNVYLVGGHVQCSTCNNINVTCHKTMLLRLFGHYNFTP